MKGAVFCAAALVSFGVRGGMTQMHLDTHSHSDRGIFLASAFRQRQTAATAQIERRLPARPGLVAGLRAARVVLGPCQRPPPQAGDRPRIKAPVEPTRSRQSKIAGSCYSVPG